MREFILLKDLPNLKSGAKFTYEKATKYFVSDRYDKYGELTRYKEQVLIDMNEWFQEVKPIPEYEIISFKKPPSSFRDYILKKYKDGNYRLEDYTVSFTLDNLLNDKDYSINSVKRTSDQQVFSVGDTHGGVSYKEREILGFFIEDGKMMIKQTGGHTELKFATKAPSRTPLFIDFNGVPVYPGDPYWCVEGNKLWYGGTAGGNSGAGKKIKYFTSEEAAKKHHIPLFTTDDGVKIFKGDIYWGILSDLKVYRSDCLIPSFINKKTPTFSTEEAANEYVLKNAPLNISWQELMNRLRAYFQNPVMASENLIALAKEKVKL